MATKRIELRAYVDVPEGLEIGLGWTANFKGKGEVVGVGEDLVRLAKGETKVTESIKFKGNPDHTTFANFAPPEGPLDEALTGDGEDA